MICRSPQHGVLTLMVVSLTASTWSEAAQFAQQAMLRTSLRAHLTVDEVPIKGSEDWWLSCLLQFGHGPMHACNSGHSCCCDDSLVYSSESEYCEKPTINSANETASNHAKGDPALAANDTSEETAPAPAEPAVNKVAIPGSEDWVRPCSFQFGQGPMHACTSGSGCCCDDGYVYDKATEYCVEASVGAAQETIAEPPAKVESIVEEYAIDGSENWWGPCSLQFGYGPLRTCKSVDKCCCEEGHVYNHSSQYCDEAPDSAISNGTVEGPAPALAPAPGNETTTNESAGNATSSTAANETSVTDTPSNETPAKEAPVNDTLANETPADETPAASPSTNDTQSTSTPEVTSNSSTVATTTVNTMPPATTTTTMSEMTVPPAFTTAAATTTSQTEWTNKPEPSTSPPPVKVPEEDHAPMP